MKLESLTTSSFVTTFIYWQSEIHLGTPTLLSITKSIYETNIFGKWSTISNFENLIADPLPHLKPKLCQRKHKVTIQAIVRNSLIYFN